MRTALINSASDFEMLDDGADDVLTPDEEAGASTARRGAVDGGARTAACRSRARAAAPAASASRGGAGESDGRAARA